jgi:hypothetical protein
MKVSYSQELGVRLQQEPFKTMGQNGVRSSIKMAFQRKNKNVESIHTDLGTWASAWLLKACSNDKSQGFGGGGAAPPPPGGPGGEMPNMEELQRQFEAAQKAKKEEL